MTEKDKREPVDFRSIKAEIIAKANREGKMGEMESWKKAFSDVPFYEVDDMFTGDEIDWEKRTMAERAFYVAYSKNPQDVEIDYVMDVDGTQLRRRIDDSEKIWYMWMDGCFTGEEELDETAIKTLLWYLDDSELARRFIKDMDLDDVKLLRLDADVAPL